MMKTTDARTAFGMYGERTGQEEQDHDDDRGSGQLRDLGPAAGAVDHLGLRRAAVDDERAADAGCGVRHAEPDEVDVLLEAVASTSSRRPATSRRSGRG